MVCASVCVSNGLQTGGVLSDESPLQEEAELDTSASHLATPPLQLTRCRQGHTERSAPSPRRKRARTHASRDVVCERAGLYFCATHIDALLLCFSPSMSRLAPMVLAMILFWFLCRHLPTHTTGDDSQRLCPSALHDINTERARVHVPFVLPHFHDGRTS
jgi:hypothetical protein